MIEAFAPAKLNLALHVTGQRDDGYHLLDSLVVFADYGDRITIEQSDTRSLAIDGPFAEGVPTGPENLIWKAVDLVDPQLGLSIRLTKNLPHGAGIGGGSSDAAAMIRALCDTTGAPLPRPDRVLALGADVPVCLAGTPARMQGIGERITPVPALPPMSMVLVNPGQPVATPACFSRLAGKDNPAMDAPQWHDGIGFLDWLSRQRNDLEEPAASMVPAISDCLNALRAARGCALARMSGSGATCFGLFKPGMAERAAEKLATDHPGWWVVATGV